VKIDGYSIKYKITGSGDKYVVILQGWGTTLEVYDSIASYLEDGYKVVQFDFPGFGGSSEPREAWDVGQYTDFFVRFMAELHIDSAIIIAHSFGGRVVLKLYQRGNIPFTIERLVMVDAAGIMPVRTRKQKAKIKRYKVIKRIVNSRIISDFFPDLVEDWKSRQGSEDYRRATPVMKQVLVKSVNEDLKEALPLISVDTLIVWGDKDTATPISDAHMMDDKIPDSGLVVFEGAGHYSFLEKPALFKSIIREYLGLGGDK